MQPPIVEREAAMLMEKDKSWIAERLPMLDDRVRTRLVQLSSRLGDAEWLDGKFSAGDLLMINVLRRPAGSALLEGYSNLAAYVARGEARPAFKRAFEAQLAVFTGSVPTSKANVRFGWKADIPVIAEELPPLRPRRARYAQVRRSRSRPRCGNGGRSCRS